MPATQKGGPPPPATPPRSQNSGPSHRLFKSRRQRHQKLSGRDRTEAVLRGHGRPRNHHLGQASMQQSLTARHGKQLILESGEATQATPSRQLSGHNRLANSHNPKPDSGRAHQQDAVPLQVVYSRSNPAATRGAVPGSPVHQRRQHGPSRQLGALNTQANRRRTQCRHQLCPHGTQLKGPPTLSRPVATTRKAPHALSRSKAQPWLEQHQRLPATMITDHHPLPAACPCGSWWSLLLPQSSLLRSL